MLRIAAVATLGLLLAGCGRLHANLEIRPDDTVNGEIIVAIIVGDGESAEQDAQAAADDVEQELLPGLRDAEGVTTETYREDGYLGNRLLLLGTPVSALEGGGVFELEREGDVYQFTGTVRIAEGETSAEGAEAEEELVQDGERDVIVSIQFPGEVTSHNGELVGERVEWFGDWNATLDMRATAMAEPTGPPAWAWVAAGATLALLLGAVVLLVVRGRRGGDGAGIVTAPSTVVVTPSPDAPLNDRDLPDTVPTAHSPE